MQVVLLNNVLERASGWENDFAIPMQYSHRTMVALQTKVITDHARHEITQEVCSRMMNYCTYPTPKQFEVVATKLVHKFPQLRDTYFTGHVRDQQQRYVNNFISKCSRDHAIPCSDVPKTDFTDYRIS